MKEKLQVHQSKPTDEAVIIGSLLKMWEAGIYGSGRSILALRLEASQRSREWTIGRIQ